MQVVNKKMCVIVILVLVIIESCTLFLMYKSYGNKNTSLDEVNLNKEINNNMFAIMLEQEDGTYKEDAINTWPTSGYTYNASMSGCIDLNGNKLDGVLTYDSTNNIATVDTGNTSYCYLYFSIPKWCNEGETASECLLRNPTASLNNTAIEAGMYRYQGTDAMNYVCFGTTSKSECTGNTDAYMYRIIGIRPNGQMKLIKKEALNSAVKWWDNNTDNKEWPDSNIYTTLNGNSYLLNGTYVPTDWESKIAIQDWYYGDTTNSGLYKGTTMYPIENPFGESTETNKFTNTVSAKIGLMYIHDYYYAYASGGAPGSYSNAKTAWIHMSKNDSRAPSSYEWPMSRYGVANNGSHFAWAVYSGGNVGTFVLSSAHSVRPVFYLTSDVKLTRGDGSSSNPFIIG
ncbi:MAG: hypothetical protein IJN13_03920 [Bacilli bacterium]|nr:hypothetical protein [Bacilli bacterium]